MQPTPEPAVAPPACAAVRFVLWDDTSPAAERVLIAAYRRMTPALKARQVDQLTLGVQQLALARLRAEDPTAGERALRLRLAALWLSPEQLERVRDHDVRVEGK